MINPKPYSDYDDYLTMNDNVVTITTSDSSGTVTLPYSNDTITLDSDSTFTLNDLDIAYSYTTPNTVTVGKHTLTEDTVGKLLALLDLIENAEDSDIHTLLNMQSALNKIGGSNGKDLSI